MVGLIFGIIIVIAGIVGGVIAFCNDEHGIGAGALAGGIVLGLIVIMCGCFGTVPTGHTGVVSVFGKVEDKTLDAGFNFKAPWEKIIKMDNRVQKAEISLSCFSSDLQEVTCAYALNYQIDKTNAQKLYKEVGIHYYETAIAPVVAESVKTVMAHYTAEELIGNRDTLAATIETTLVEQLSKYNIELVSTAIEDLDFTDTFTNAVESKQVAAQNKLKAEIEQQQAIKQAQADAEVAKTKAEADASVAKTKAQADAEIAQIQAEADRIVAQIGSDSAEYQGKKEAAIALQRLASINGWTVVTDSSGINMLIKADGKQVSAEELKIGTENLMQYYYTMQWDGKLPETFLGDNINGLIEIAGR